MCQLHPGSHDIPLMNKDSDGDEHEINCPTSVLWPWDVCHWLWESGIFLQWASDDPGEAADRVDEYWQHCRGLDFFRKLKLPESEFRRTVPLVWHTDGVKVYKTQKAWVYSYSSTCRKGPSMSTKLVLLVFRDTVMIKNKTHDAVGLLIAYIMDVLQTGCFPTTDFQGRQWFEGSPEARKAGTPYAGGWKMAFAGFKGDWEARVQVHKLSRHYNAKFICEHCMASRAPAWTFGDFSDSASCLTKRFSHEEFTILNAPGKQSSWQHVRGWTKDRNLEDPCLPCNLLFP